MDTENVGTRPKLPVVDAEVPFAFEELFFSRTDWRGVIQAGNTVFQRVSIYDWNELFQKPHNVIRHPDMPKAVFWLLWDMIKRGEPVGAYVKNRAKDGRYYWVFAIVTPIEGGYLSVRLKPSSPIFTAIVQEYASLLAAVPDSKAGAKAGVEVLSRRLSALGFDDYASFMAAALSQEIAARDQRLGRRPDAAIACFDELLTAAKSLLKQADLIFEAYARSEYVPINLRVQAAHLGQSGTVIDTISSNYNLISTEIRNNMDRFIASAASVLKTINDGLFLLCTATIQREAEEQFRREIALSQDAGGGDRDAEMRLLEAQRSHYREKTIDGLAAINDRAGSFRRDCAEMKRLAAGLEVTRIMGKMESARLAVVKDGLNELIDDLEAFQTTITENLKEIDTNNQNIQVKARKLATLVDGLAIEAA
ncbi:PAS domain-containing protein [Bosea sp. (in: a-proteobacteria)]|uniref:PAS domain-containing protein n=1 Tax=Bosea sp. (in: a-proteobacteria) TaxID=1871050 RepID=UPI00262CCB16|nr:PAS domain-containing protein [Bosea sp. (in: a-proteobacteria)]